MRSTTQHWDAAFARLYRIQEDPHEDHDFAVQHPEIVERLRQKIAAWHARLACSLGMLAWHTQVPVVQAPEKRSPASNQ